MTLPTASVSLAESPSEASANSRSRRLLVDKLARYVFVCGGWIILLSICAILIVISLEVIPLFKPAQVTARSTVSTPIGGMAMFIDDYRENAVLITANGSVSHLRLDGSISHPVNLPSLAGEQIAAAAVRGGDSLLAATADGALVLATIAFRPLYEDGVRSIIPSLTWQEPVPLFRDGATPTGSDIRAVTFARPDGNILAAVQTGSNKISLLQQKRTRSLMGPSATTTDRALLETPEGNITSLALDERADYLVVGTDTGKVYSYELRNTLSIDAVESYRVTDVPITVLRFALGGRTVLIGDAIGGVQSWLFVKRPEKTGFIMQRVNVFRSHSAPITHIEPSLRNKVFLTGDTTGSIQVNHATTGSTLATIPATAAPMKSVSELTLAPRGNAVFAYGSDGSLRSWDLDNPHPEISLKTLFAPVHYEGYSEPAYVWQSSGGTDNFEPKLSLVPLIFGTLKGTLYALIFSVPLALLAAFYASQFMSPRIKSYIKPLLEIMAALPSVVIGFIAGLWLAPVLEPHLLAIFCMPLTIVVALIATCFISWRLKNLLRLANTPGIEMLIAIPVIAAAVSLSFPLGNGLEAGFFAGNFNQWLYSSLGIRVDQRNSIIAGIAVGFAVIPIIFTIADDCLSSVPRALSAGSLALGATRWQTATRVVFPVAAPGIFAAVMIGLGRAVGETMIVLMATGNTPIIDLSAFTGFRALSANIAVELPEAPQGGTLYRVLFLTAFILFVLTFILNTLSEFVRSHLRKKYGAV